MYYPDYLVHYNKNHSPKNGQFTSGDGDGDGISNDHAHRSKKKASKRSPAKNATSKKATSRRKKMESDADEVFNEVMGGITNSLNTMNFALERDPQRKFEKGMNLMLDNSKILNSGKAEVRSKSDLVFDALDDIAYAGKLYLTARAKPGERFSKGTDLLGYTWSR